jgi:hypothetical protein
MNHYVSVQKKPYNLNRKETPKTPDRNNEDLFFGLRMCNRNNEDLFFGLRMCT